MPTHASRPASAAAVALVVTVVILLVAFLFYPLLVVAAPYDDAPGVFLSRMVDGGAITGVEREWRYRCVRRARRRLLALGNRPAVLVQRGAFWYVLSGRELTVVPATAGGGACADAVVVEFTTRSQPVVAVAGLRPPAVAEAPRPVAGPDPGPAPAVEWPPNAREIRGRSGAVLLASIDTRQPIRSFPTLEQALSVARPSTEEGGDTIDYIVGGSQSHPMYYVVTVVRGAGTGAPPSASTAGPGVVGDQGPPDSRIWVRVD